LLANVMILAVMLARTMANSFAMGVAGVVFSLAASLFYALLFLFHVREKAAFQQGGGVCHHQSSAAAIRENSDAISSQRSLERIKQSNFNEMGGRVWRTGMTVK
jgi:hypothetical protein